jgi:tetratricopeptide (TPR) repeat protein
MSQPAESEDVKDANDALNAPQASSSPSPEIRTGGGAAVTGDVVVERGDFIGRDKVTKVNLPRGVLIGLGALIVIAIIAAAVAIVQSLRPRLPERMAGDFNVAIAGFEQSGGEAGIGLEVATRIYTRAVDLLSGDPTFLVWPPTLAGKVAGQTAEARERNARALADAINADVVVYGVITTTDAGQQIAPEFYARERRFSQINEATGAYALGEPIRVSGQDNPAERAKTSASLSARARWLVNIVLGLSHYSVRQFEEAAVKFKAAADGGDCADDDCRKTALLMAGNALTALSEKQLERLTEAKQAYSDTLAIDPEYARAWLGLGIAYRLQALPPITATGESADPGRNTDFALVSASIQMLQRANAARNKPPLAEVPSRLHFHLGEAYLLLALGNRPPGFARATEEFQTVIAAYDLDTTNERLRQLAAEAHARQGLILALQGDVAKAADKYALAATLLTEANDAFVDPERIQHFKERAEKLRPK